MKRRFLAVAISLITALSLAGCGEKEEEIEINDTPRVREEKETTPTPEPEPTPETLYQQEPPQDPVEPVDYYSIYAPVLDQIYDVLTNGYDFDREYRYLPTGLMESVMYEDKDKLMASVGYLITDISGDGIPELLVGRNEQADTSAPGEVSTVYACYACPDDEPVMAFEGMTRSSFRWLGDGKFYYFGSSGASYSAFGICHINDDGTDNVWDDFYFTDENDDLSLSFYHNTTGVWDPSMAEKLEISDVDFWNLLSDVTYELIDWDYFDAYYYAGDTAATAAKVTVEWADDVVDETTDYISYEPDHTDQYTTHVLISFDKEVKDFRLYELALTDVDDDGNAVFDKTEVYKINKLTPDEPLCAGMNFPGDTPHNGFKYTDADGETHFYVIDVSGRDGSLYISEQ